MKDLLVYIIYIIFGNIIRLIPRYFVKYIIKYIAYIAYIVDTRHKKISYANLDLVYKDTLSNKSKKDIVVGAYINAVLNVYEHIVNQTKSLEDMEKSISLVND